MPIGLIASASDEPGLHPSVIGRERTAGNRIKRQMDVCTMDQLLLPSETDAHF